jgi:hypothetical protein
MPRRTADDIPKVRALTQADGDFNNVIDVSLTPGQAICAARDPILCNEGVVRSDCEGGARWQATALAKIGWASRGAANLVQVDVGKAEYLMAADLVLLWTSGVQFAVLPDQPVRLVRVTGAGRVWSECPGYTRGWPALDLRAPILLDPAQLVYFTNAAVSPAWVTGPTGLPWIRLEARDKAVWRTFAGSPRSTCSV